VSDIDARVRLAAFEFLEATRRRLGSEGAFSRALLAEGFIFEGQRVPLIAPQGIFKPRVLPEIPLSITTVPIVEGQERPYEDVLGADGRLQYRYRGLDLFIVTTSACGWPCSARFRSFIFRGLFLVFTRPLGPFTS
jgi:hypothetical protein